MKRTIATTLILFCIVLVSGETQAQFHDVRNLYFDTLVIGDFEPTPIGVSNMIYTGTDYISARDSLFMTYATSVVRSDIDFYADFDLVRVDSFYLRTYEITELDLLGWQRMGAYYLVRLEAEFMGDNMRIRWRLWDTERDQQFANGTVERHKADWRVIGHEVANEVVHILTGEQGIFLTEVTYIRKIGGAKELFLADYDGANERQLTANGSINLSPSFSPVNNTLYFISYMNGDPGLFVCNLDNNDIAAIGDYPGIMAAPSVSPDGDKIALVLSKDGNSEIYVLGLNGQVIKRLTRHWSIDTSPTWSPDGLSIAFSSDRSGAPQIYIMDSDGLNVRRLTFQGRYNDSPIWSLRGDRLTFVTRTKSGRFDLATIDTSGADYVVLTDLGQNENPHFSPDGKHIVFTSSRLGPQDIFTMDMTGRRQRRLTRYNGCSNPNWGPLR
jgi:TolB protein